MNKKRRCKLVVTCGLLGLMLLGGAPASKNMPVSNPFVIEAQAAEAQPYSHRWETQADGSWKYKLDNGSYASGWIQDEVDKQWYLLDSAGTMRSGVYKSYGKYYLLSENHDGHFGHLVVNGENYNGISITADTSTDYQGALSESSLQALRNAGYNIDGAVDVSGTQHVSDGKVVSGGQTNIVVDSNVGTEASDSLIKKAEGIPVVTEDDIGWDSNSDGVLDANEQFARELMKDYEYSYDGGGKSNWAH